MTKGRFDIKQHVTDTIIAQIEAGTPPWRKPWTGGASGACLPLRHTGEPYKGINVVMLWATAMERGHHSPRWMTFKQARDLGGTVRKGEKATKSVYYGTIEREDERAGEGETRAIPFAKMNNVFCADQIDGLPEDYYLLPDPPRDLGTTTDPALEAFFASTGAEILTSDDPRAYYSPAEDHIHMPPIATFISTGAYFGVLGHETIHWTGSKKRLGRIETFASKKAYAFEELVAEIGACFLGVQLGLDPQFDQSAAYIESWLAAMKAEKDLIFKAAAEAQKAVDLINALATTAETERAA